MKAIRIVLTAIFVLSLVACSASAGLRIGTPIGVSVGGSGPGPGHCPPGQAKKGNC